VPNHSDDSHISVRFLSKSPEWYWHVVGFGRPSLFGSRRCAFVLGIIEIVADLPTVEGCYISRGHYGVIRLPRWLLGSAQGVVETQLNRGDVSPGRVDIDSQTSSQLATRGKREGIIKILVE